MGVCVRGGDSYYDLSIAKIPHWKVVYRLIHEIGNTHTHTHTHTHLLNSLLRQNMDGLVDILYMHIQFMDSQHTTIDKCKCLR